MPERISPIERLVKRRETLVHIIDVRTGTHSRIGVAPDAQLVPKPLSKDQSPANRSLIGRVRKVRMVVYKSIANLHAELTAVDRQLSDAIPPVLSDKERQQPVATTEIPIYAATKSVLPRILERIQLAQERRAAAEAERRYTLPDGKVTEGNKAILLYTLENASSGDETVSSSTLRKKIFPTSPNNGTPRQMHKLIGYTRELIAPHGWAIVNVSKERGSGGSEGKYLLDKGDWINPLHLNALALFTAGLSVPEIIKTCHVSEQAAAGRALIEVASRLTAKEQAGTLTAREADVYRHLPNLSIDTLREQIRKEFKVVDKPEIFVLPESIILSSQQEKLFDALQGTSLSHVATVEELFAKSGSQSTKPEKAIKEAIESLRKKLNTTDVEVHAAVTVSKAGDERKGYYMRRAAPPREIALPPKKEIVLPQEEPAEYGSFSRVDVVLLAGALNAHHAFLNTVLDVAGVDSQIGKQTLMNVLDLAGDVPIVDQERKDRAAVIRGMRERALGKIGELLASSNRDAVFAELKSTNPDVAEMLKNIAAAAQLRAEVVIDKKLMWVEGMAAVSALLTEPNVGKEGVRVSHGEGVFSEVTQLPDRTIDVKPDKKSI